MLRAQRRILRRGGLHATLVIEIAPGLDHRARRRARSLGPPNVATSSTYPALIRSAGLSEIGRIDLTGEYRETAVWWLTERRRHADAYRAAVGDALYDERISTGEGAIDAIDAGLLRRTLYVARRP